MKEINSILHADLRPFLPDIKGDDYYLPAFRGLNVIQENFTPHYSVKFSAPEFSAKIKYYKRVIDNDVSNELNTLFDSLKNGDTDLILYRRKKLFEQIKSAMDDTKRYIEQNQYDLAEIISPHADFSRNPQHAECVYIFNYMLTALIRCYMEFQSHFIVHIEQDKRFEIADFYTQILKRQVPANTFIQVIQTIELQVQQEVQQPAEPENNASFVYVNLDTNPDAISDLFNSLKDVAKLIDAQTKLVDFKRIFSGKSITRPIVWIGSQTELYYFIKYIHNIHKAVKDTNKQQWNIACNCFVKTDKSPFDKAKLKALKTPAADSKQKVESAANNLIV